MRYIRAARAASLVVAIMVLAAALSALTSCGGSKTITLGSEDSGTPIEVRQGQQITVRLPSNSASGHGWFVADPGPLSQTGQGAAEGKPKTEITGSAEMQTFTFEAGSPGSGELALEYRSLHNANSGDSQLWSTQVTVR